MSLACALAGTLVLCVGCSEGEGGRCEIDSDCSSGLVCRFTGSPYNGVCTPNLVPGSGGSGGSTGAAGSVADAADEGPVAAADAGADGLLAAVDTASDSAESATVGGDYAPDAEAAADLLSTD